MDYSSGWPSSNLPLYQPRGQLQDAYLQAPTQQHDPYKQTRPAQQYDSYQNVAPHYQSISHHYSSNPLQSQPLYDQSSYDQSHYHNYPHPRYASSQSHYQSFGTEAGIYLHRTYTSDGVPRSTGVEVESFLSYPATAAGAQGYSVKDAIRQFGTDPSSHGGPVLLHPSSSVGVNPAPRPMGRTGTNFLGPRHLKNTMKKKAKGPNTVNSQPAYCQVCQVHCNSEEMLKNHKAGKKHKKNLENLKESISIKPSKPPSAAPQQPSKTTKPVTQPVTANPTTAEGVAKPKKKKTGSVNEDLETKKRKVLECGAPAEGVKMCTICNVVCNSPVVFNYHLAGHRHKAMVQKLKEEQQVAK